MDLYGEKKVFWTAPKATQCKMANVSKVIITYLKAEMDLFRVLHSYQ